MTASVSGLPPPKELDSVEPSDVYVVPRGLVHGEVVNALVNCGHAFRLCSETVGFSAIEVIVREADTVRRFAGPVSAFDSWRRVLKTPLQEHIAIRLNDLATYRAPFAGLALDRTQIMGVVNVTPDSFSDGGDHPTAAAAIAHGLKLAEQGADILDVGGESTRPGAEPVAPKEEQRRVVPVVLALAEKGLTVSIDTRHASTMDAALEAGAAIVNDVTALTGDKEALHTVVERKAPVILMHMQGRPRTMQYDPTYTWAPVDIFDVLTERVQTCVDAGLDKTQICIDPGIGFGKNDGHNLAILNALTLFHGLRCPLMVGASRKSFIGRLSQTKDPKRRLPGSLATAMTAQNNGVQFVRVHDVAETQQALKIARSIDTLSQH